MSSRAQGPPGCEIRCARLRFQPRSCSLCWRSARFSYQVCSTRQRRVSLLTTRRQRFDQYHRLRAGADAVTRKPPLCLVKLQAKAQCGGKGGDCQKYRYDLKKCQDAPYQKACCPAGHSCQRYSEYWRECNPVKTEAVRRLPARSAVIPKSRPSLLVVLQ
jgi:hypothetical protein